MLIDFVKFGSLQPNERWNMGQNVISWPLQSAFAVHGVVKARSASQEQELSLDVPKRFGVH